MNLINPVRDLGLDLNKVQNPGQFIGGEYGAIVKPHLENQNLYNFAMCFPDIYDIGMSNQAIKIIYNALNKIQNVRCERVFACDKDFEQILRQKKIPLYTLETGMPLHQCDMIGFSIGYELGITGVLECLDLGGVPLLAKDRKEGDPVIVAGGCGVTNPLPFADFFDAVFIGEAENKFFDFVEDFAKLKEKGATRQEMILKLDEYENIWTLSKHNAKKVTRRAVQDNFGIVPSVQSWYPLPNTKPVQDHGVVEIMRGCPNGCRFCHAGIFYRPQRAKSRELILEEIDHLVFECGYREVSLTSLSSADYPNISQLLDEVNSRYNGYNVSFQLPSLKVNSLGLDILEKLSSVRRSGLTFAIETPEEMWQLSLNKEVYAQHLKEIIWEAKKRGWSSAKFYFMIGLPLGDYFENYTGKTEEQAIVDFLIDLQRQTRIQCNVNVGVFIPKPHTAYQWVKQISKEDAHRKIEYIWQNLPRGKFKLGRHNYDMTTLEGLLSRGDLRAGSVILNAYKKGARLDAWDDKLREDMVYWNQSFEEADYDVKGYIYKDWDLEEELPWDSVSLGTSKNFFKKEWERSLQSVLTPKCEENCSHLCGICNKKDNTKARATEETVERDRREIPQSPVISNVVPLAKIYPESNIPVLYRVLFTFTKLNGGEYISYLAQVEHFHKAFLRTSLPVVYTNGFNPLPRIEFATALGLGIPSEEEIASCVLYNPVEAQEFVDEMNRILPGQFRIQKAFIFPVTNLRKRESLSDGLWGSEYIYDFLPGFDASDYMSQFVQNPDENLIVTKLNESSYKVKVGFHREKKFKVGMEEFFGGKKIYEFSSVKKIHTFAKDYITGWTAECEKSWRNGDKHVKPSTTGTGKPRDFYDLYEEIAKVNADLMEVKEQMPGRMKNHPEKQTKNSESSPQ